MTDVTKKHSRQGVRRSRTAAPRSWSALGLGALWVAGAAAGAVSAPRPARAAPEERIQMDVRGNFVLFGNTLAQDCALGAPTPAVGVIEPPCPDVNPYAPDVFWQANPSTDSATTNVNFTSVDARSVAVLNLPDEAEVVYARLYWGGFLPNATPDTEIRLQRSETNLDAEITADADWSVAQPGVNAFFYQASADVSDLVAEQGPGAFLVTGVDSTLTINASTGSMAAWYMVVFYEQETEPQRNLTVFDGLDFVDGQNPQSAQLSGFKVPNLGFDATLGVVAFEGESQLVGDVLRFNGTALSNANNPADNFFNASRTRFGQPVSSVGDLPQLSGAPQSLSNVDLDVVDVTRRVRAGDSSASIEATSSGDIYLLSSFVTAISTLTPILTESTKEVTDLNGDTTERGDTLEYRIVVRNTGNDPAEEVVLRDPLAEGLTFVPGSIEIESGSNAGPQSDAAGDDFAEYDESTRTLRVRLGEGATAAAGGTLEVGEEIAVVFQATINEDAGGVIENQGFITFIGRAGTPETETPTDADSTTPGQTPTTIEVDGCESDDDCMEPTPFCEVTKSPRVCVECATSAQCTDPLAPDCNPDTNTCECVSPEPDGSCPDTDGDGISDGAEEDLGTDPNNADTDNDGALDGAELGAYIDSDGDGLINAIDPDSDDDALPDGTELGFACDHPDTDPFARNCRVDGDQGATRTDPTRADTDGGGVRDGSEDLNLDGTVDDMETDPTLGHEEDDAMALDSDSDGLSDGTEVTLGTDPQDADSDDDGVSDGSEINPGSDDDGDGLPGALDVDSDNDGLLDGTELGLACSETATDLAAEACVADADNGESVTSPVVADTDGGGVKDGSEDSNLNGAVDDGETNPVLGQSLDDEMVVDSDGDGLSDALEETLGSDPSDQDSDDDGLIDGLEPNPSHDHDKDGALSPLDADSDNDGLFDGLELGKGCDNTDTSGAAATCFADADNGATRTSPLNEDTDRGGLSDSAEDANGNGQVDADETDPNKQIDDQPCADDSDCGTADSGTVCIDMICTEGCRGVDGNGCPDGQVCSSDSNEPGMCEFLPEPMPEPDAGVEEETPEPPPPDLGEFAGGGCDCSVRGSGVPMADLLWVGLPLLLLRRRRGRAGERS